MLLRGVHMVAFWGALSTKIMLLIGHSGIAVAGEMGKEQ